MSNKKARRNTATKTSAANKKAKRTRGKNKINHYYPAIVRFQNKVLQELI